MLHPEEVELAVTLHYRSYQLLKWLGTGRLSADPQLEADAALAAYGEHLVARTKGRSAGPAVLVLWRRIAWDPAGSPRKKFKLEAAEILAAEGRLAGRLRAICSPGS